MQASFEKAMESASSIVSFQSELPEPLHRALTVFIERHPHWDQYRLVQEAIAGMHPLFAIVPCGQVVTVDKDQRLIGKGNLLSPGKLHNAALPSGRDMTSQKGTIKAAHARRRDTMSSSDNVKELGPPRTAGFTPSGYRRTTLSTLAAEPLQQRP